MWTTILEKINTLDNFQVRRPNIALSPEFVSCVTRMQRHASSSCYCFMAEAIWLEGRAWGFPSFFIGVNSAKIILAGFGRSKRQKTLRRCASYSDYLDASIEEQMGLMYYGIELCFSPLYALLSLFVVRCPTASLFVIDFY